MNHGSLFSGIGGFDLAAKWMGWNNVFNCEIDEFCRKVLKKNFPKSIQHHDIKKTDFTIYRGRVDVLSGGFPCQPFSVAGKRKGSTDDRALWHEMFRAIREIKPTFIVAENVSGLLTIEKGLVFENLCIDLENEGYEVQPVIIPACAKDAPHRRDRLWIVAHSNSIRCVEWKPEINTTKGRQQTQSESCKRIRQNNAANPQKTKCESYRNTRTGWNGFTNDNSNASNSDATRLQRQRNKKQQRENKLCTRFNRGQSESWDKNWYEVAAEFCRMDDGVSDRVDRLKSLGNAIVSQIAFEIFKTLSA